MTRIGPVPLIKKPGQPACLLSRLNREHRRFDEQFLQDLLAENPEVLPVRHIRPDAGELILIGREVRVGCGSIDNLYLSTAGYPVIVETKLWRNPQSRREVLSQTLDYVKEVVRKDFEWLSRQFDSHTRSKGNTGGLLDYVSSRSNGEGDESEFVDRVNGAMVRGDVIAMIVGDGIESGLQELVAHLCRDSTHLRYSLALVELSCYELGSEQDGLLVIPRIVRDIEPVQRAYVRIDIADSLREKIVVTPKVDPEQDPPERTRPPTLSEEEFWERVSRHVAPDSLNAIKAFVHGIVKECVLTPEFKTDSLLLKTAVAPGDDASVAVLGIRGNGGLINPRSLGSSLINSGFSPALVDQIKTEFWTGLHRIDNRFPLAGIRVLDRLNCVPFADMQERLPKIKDTATQCVERIRSEFRAIEDVI